MVKSAIAKTILIGLVLIPITILGVGFSLLMSWTIIIVCLALAVLAFWWFKKALHCTGQIILNTNKRDNFITLSWLAAPFILLCLWRELLPALTKLLTGEWRDISLWDFPWGIGALLTLYILIQDSILLLKK